MDDFVVHPSLTIPGKRLSWTASRSGGPGGQNVNKVNSKVTLRVDLNLDPDDEDPWIRPEWLRRFRENFGSRLNVDGTMVIQSEATRDQRKNLMDAMDRLASMLLSCRLAPKPRKKTKPSRSARRRRVEAKRRVGEKKQSRRERWD